MSTAIDIPLSADLYLASVAPTTNTDASTVFDVGEYNGATGDYRRGWIKPSFAGIPPFQILESAVAKLTPVADYSDNARTMRAHRCLRAVVAAQATWNIYSTGNNWGTAGCGNSSTDYDGAVEMGNMSVPASPTLNVAMSLTFSAAGVAELQKMYDGTYVNNGILLFMDTQLNDATRYASLEHATSGYRPYITFTYRSGGMAAFF